MTGHAAFLFFPAVLWGIAIMMAFSRGMNWLRDSRYRNNAPGIILLSIPVLMVVAAGPMFAVARYTAPDDPVIATLHESEWRCTAPRQQFTTVLPVKNGMIPIFTSQCDRYERIKR